MNRDESHTRAPRNRRASLCVLLACWMPPPLMADTVDGIAAVVNDDIITDIDVASSLDTLFEDQATPGPRHASPSELRHLVLRRLIEQRLMIQEAKRAGVSVTASEIVKQLLSIRNRFSSEGAFQDWLSEMGLSAERLKEKLHSELMVKRLIDAKVRSAIFVSPQEVSQELAAHPELAKAGDRVRVSHILVRINDARTEQDARALSDDLHAQLSRGADFSDVARRFSEDSHREEGGAMGWVAPGELLPELDQIVGTMQVGGVSEPIRTTLGFHLMKVEERRPATSLSTMEANHAVYEQLYQKKFQSVFNRWLNGLKRQAYINIPGSAEPSGP